jgi:sortase A
MVTPMTAPGRSDRPARRRALRWRTVIGLTLVLSGISVLGWVGWQYYGTDYVSKRAQAALVQDTEAAWEAQETKDPLEVPAAADALIRIPRFGEDYVMPVQTLRGQR